MITSIKSPFLEYKMTILRNKKTSNSLFRQTMNEASYLIAAEVLGFFVCQCVLSFCLYLQYGFMLLLSHSTDQSINDVVGSCK